MNTGPFLVLTLLYPFSLSMLATSMNEYALEVVGINLFPFAFSSVIASTWIFAISLTSDIGKPIGGIIDILKCPVSILCIISSDCPFMFPVKVGPKTPPGQTTAISIEDLSASFSMKSQAAFSASVLLFM